ncbi:MAG: M90 family metallopeptidase [Balneolales bacterium]
MFGFKRRRRQRYKSKPFPEEWICTLEQNVLLYRYLPDDKKQRVHGDIQVFLNEKRFEGCGGLRITEEIRLTISAQACIMILGGISDYFPSLVSILVYPHIYNAPVRDLEEGGIVTEGYESRQGEAWDMGSLVLSWKNVRQGTRHADGKNLVLHEFAHLLDSELGATENWNTGTGNSTYAQWSRILHEEHQSLARKIERGEPVLFDAYGATSLVEFFAVATECFFELPNKMLRLHPDLYNQMQFFYAQDPTLFMKD